MKSLEILKTQFQRSRDTIWLKRHYDVKMMSVSFQQLRHIIIQQIKPLKGKYRLTYDLKINKLALPCCNDDVLWRNGTKN